MSDIAILTGVSRYLRYHISDWNPENCKGMPDGQPDPAMGQYFCSVWVREIQSRVNITDGYHEEIWGISVTVTRRLQAVPYDRINDSIYLTQLTGISQITERTLYALQNRWGVVEWINNHLVYDDPDMNKFVKIQKFMHPLVLISRSPNLEFREESWFHGTHGTVPRDLRDGFTGVSLTLNFGNLLKHTVLQVDDCIDESLVVGLSDVGDLPIG